MWATAISATFFALFLRGCFCQNLPFENLLPGNREGLRSAKCSHSVLYKVKICRSSSTNQNDGIFFPFWHRPRVIEFARDYDVATNCKVALLIAQSNNRSAGNHYDILVVCVPVQVEMRASRKHRVICSSLRDWVVPLRGCTDTHRKAIAASGWAPLQIAHIHCERLNIRRQGDAARKQAKQWQDRFQSIFLLVGERLQWVTSRNYSANIVTGGFRPHTGPSVFILATVSVRPEADAALLRLPLILFRLFVQTPHHVASVQIHQIACQSRHRQSRASQFSGFCCDPGRVPA